MYNRYIPRPDGSFQKNTVQDPAYTHPTQSIPIPPPPPPPGPQEPPSAGPPDHPPVESFLKRLLPKDLDTGDLLIILLLLLMAGDKKEGSASALLTLALYLVL